MAQQELCIQWEVPPLDPQLDTLPKNFLKQVAQHGNRQIAMRKKRYGIWQEFSWQDSYERVHDFALGMLALGLKRGDKLCIIGDNDPEYFWAELAGHSIGLTAVGVFTDAAARELEYVIQSSDSVLIIAQDQEQCDKMLELRERVPQILKVIYWDEGGMWGYQDDWLMRYEAVQQLGKKYGEQHPNAFQQAVAQGNQDDIAVFSYTSGTTGLPKAAMISHRSLLYAANRHTYPDQRLDSGEDYVSFSPMAWIAEQGLGLTTHVSFGTIVNFPEKPETVQGDIREVAPHSLLFPSRLWESLVSQVQARMVDASWLNRAIYRTFLPVGYKIADLAEQGKAPSTMDRLLYWFGDLALFAPLRDKLGLRRIKFAYTSGSALSPDVLRFFRALNIELLQLYGSTECQTHTHHRLGEVRLGTVGEPPPGVRVRVTDEGEVAIMSRSMFDGYYKAPEKTAEVVREGWYYTGDAGYIEQESGHLIYLDRMSDMIELASGERFSPQYIEGRLKFSPYIQDVMTVGGFDMPYVTALITLAFDNVARWAEKRGIAFTTMVDLSQKPQVYDLIAEEVERVNKLLPPASRIRKFFILHKSFDADEAELTRSRKLRRRHLVQVYGDLLEAVYGGKSDAVLRSEIIYQDGRKGMTENMIHIRNVGDVSDLPILGNSTPLVHQ